MSLLRSIRAIHATTLRSALACALAAGAGFAYYVAIDWEDVAMATNAEAVTMPPVVRVTLDAVPGGEHLDSFEYALAEPTADDLAPADHTQAPPLVSAPLYTGSLNARTVELSAVETPLARDAEFSARSPERSMLEHAWAPSEMLLPPKDTADDSVPAARDDSRPMQHAHSADVMPPPANVTRTMTASAVDALGDEALHAAVRTSVALAPLGESDAPFVAPTPSTVMPIATDPSPLPIQIEPDASAGGEDADIAPPAVSEKPAAVEKKPAARPAKSAKRKATKPQGSAIENGFYSIQREISSFFN